MAQSIEATGGSRSRRLMLVLSVVVLALVGFANKAAAFDYDPGDSSRNEGVTTLDIPPLHASEPSDMLRAGLPPWHRTKLRVYHLEPHAQARGIAMSVCHHYHLDGLMCAAHTIITYLPVSATRSRAEVPVQRDTRQYQLPATPFCSNWTHITERCAFISFPMTYLWRPQRPRRL